MHIHSWDFACVALPNSLILADNEVDLSPLWDEKSGFHIAFSFALDEDTKYATALNAFIGPNKELIQKKVRAAS